MRYSKNLEPNIVYPQNSEYITSHVDMERAYKAFSNTYNIPENSFILTKGSEEAIQLCFRVIEYIRVNYYGRNIRGALLYDSMLDSLPVSIERNNLYDWDNYHRCFYEFNHTNQSWIDHTRFSEFKDVYQNSLCVFISPLFYNGFHSTPIPFMQPNPDKYLKYLYDKTIDAPILQYAYEAVEYWSDKHTKLPYQRVYARDVTPLTYIVEDDRFCNTNLLVWQSIIQKNIKKYKFRFSFGSYDIALGPGIQLGYVLYHPDYNWIFKSFAPKYISPLAAMHCQVRIPDFYARREKAKEDIKRQEPKFEPEILLEDKYVDIHPNFITMMKDDYKGPEERIDCEFEDNYTKTKFVRLGMIKE